MPSSTSRWSSPSRIGNLPNTLNRAACTARAEVPSHGTRVCSLTTRKLISTSRLGLDARPATTAGIGIVILVLHEELPAMTGRWPEVDGGAAHHVAGWHRAQVAVPFRERQRAVILPCVLHPHKHGRPAQSFDPDVLDDAAGLGLHGVVAHVDLVLTDCHRRTPPRFRPAIRCRSE